MHFLLKLYWALAKAADETDTKDVPKNKILHLF